MFIKMNVPQQGTSQHGDLKATGRFRGGPDILPGKSGRKKLLIFIFCVAILSLLTEMTGGKISCRTSDEYLREDQYKSIGLICSFLLFFLGLG